MIFIEHFYLSPRQLERSHIRCGGCCCSGPDTGGCYCDLVEMLQEMIRERRHTVNIELLVQSEPWGLTCGCAMIAYIILHILVHHDRLLCDHEVPPLSFIYLLIIYHLRTIWSQPSRNQCENLPSSILPTPPFSPSFF